MKKPMLTAVACAAMIGLAAPTVAAASTGQLATYVAARRDGLLVTYTLASPADLRKEATLTEVVEPEVSGWVMAMLGFAGLGAAIRAGRQRLLRSVNTYAF